MRLVLKGSEKQPEGTMAPALVPPPRLEIPPGEVCIRDQFGRGAFASVFLVFVEGGRSL